MSNTLHVEQQVDGSVKLFYNVDMRKCNTGVYTELISKLIANFNEQFDNIYACYENSSDLKDALENELDIFNKINRQKAKIKTLENQIINLNQKLKENKQTAVILSDVKTEIENALNNLANKYKEQKEVVNNLVVVNNIIDNTSEQVDKSSISQAIDDANLDYELLDKIAERVPEGTDILLKNIVKDINGTAKGLSDFVMLFQKHGQLIENYNKVAYFQRKGCHFIKRIN
jgi:DNA repair exonuclease SbcCD ATPase subunit